MSIRIPYLVLILLSGMVALNWLQSPEHPLPDDLAPLPRASLIGSYRAAGAGSPPGRHAGYSWGTTLDASSGDR